MLTAKHQGTVATLVNDRMLAVANDPCAVSVHPFPLLFPLSLVLETYLSNIIWERLHEQAHNLSKGSRL
jgi:hypothetical protein